MIKRTANPDDAMRPGTERQEEIEVVKDNKDQVKARYARNCVRKRFSARETKKLSRLGKVAGYVLKELTQQYFR